MKLLADVSFNRLTMSELGDKVTLSFSDTFSGEDEVFINCYDVSRFEYENAFDEDDSLPSFVGIVKIEENPSKNSFRVNGESVLQIIVEGGEVFITIECSKYERTSKNVRVG